VPQKLNFFRRPQPLKLISTKPMHVL